MKLLLLGVTAVLSLLFAAADRLAPPTADVEARWPASAPIHSPR